MNQEEIKITNAKEGLEEFLADPFHGCALIAYIEIAQETRKVPPDSELVRKRAYQYFEEEKQRRSTGDFQPSDGFKHLFNADGTVK